MQDLRKVTTYQAGVMQATAHRLLQKHCDDVLKKYGITKMQWLIIGTILDAGAKGMRVSDLAEIVGTNLSYLTNTLNLLESKGVVQRQQHQTDSRAKLVTISPDFIGECEEIEETLRDSLRTSIYAGIDPKEFRIYFKVMAQLAHLPAKENT